MREIYALWAGRLAHFEMLSKAAFLKRLFSSVSRMGPLLVEGEILPDVQTHRCGANTVNERSAAGTHMGDIIMIMVIVDVNLNMQVCLPHVS